MSSAAVHMLEDDIEAFVRQRLPKTPGHRPRSDAIIRDPVWGDVRLHPWELEVIDTPLFWRLKWLHQTSLVFFIYPGANHTRLEHSIGVVAGAERILGALEANCVEEMITPVRRLSVRMAALLHDIGHTVFSHLGEQQLRSHPWIRALRASNRMYETPKVHELLSALIVRSRAFREFFHSAASAYSGVEPALLEIRLDEVAGFILGCANPEHIFLAQIINGPFDADKLDYLQRDSLHTGARTFTDVGRLLASCTCVSEASDAANRIAVREAAAPVLEQILFNKLLFATMATEHHKVRAANAVFNKYFQHIRANGGVLPESERFSTPSAFLRRTDAEWLQGEKPSGELASLTEQLLNRNLPRRALVVSSATIEDSDDFHRLQQAVRSPGFIVHLEQAILDTVSPYDQSHPLTIRDIYVDLPPIPGLGESGALVVKRDGQVCSLAEFLPLDNIRDSFARNKWTGYVFSNAGSSEQLLKTAKAAAEVFRAEGFAVLDEAFLRARLSPEEVWAAY